MSTYLDVCNDGEQLVDISEDIFDRVNIRYTEEYETYVSRVDQLLSPEESILSVGVEHHYNRIITWTNIYNFNSSENEKEAESQKENEFNTITTCRITTCRRNNSNCYT